RVHALGGQAAARRARLRRAAARHLLGRRHHRDGQDRGALQLLRRPAGPARALDASDRPLPALAAGQPLSDDRVPREMERAPPVLPRAPAGAGRRRRDAAGPGGERHGAGPGQDRAAGGAELLKRSRPEMGSATVWSALAVPLLALASRRFGLPVTVASV